jgi:RimJ/RimL family protein N-acetyltransferase
MIDYEFGVSLGPLRENNVELYYEQRNLPEIWRWCRQNDLLTVGSHIEWFQKVIYPNDKIKMYEILNENEACVGVCGLTDIDLYNRRAEFSLYIFPHYQGNGYAKNGLKTLFTHGFLNLGLNTIWGETFDGNPALNMFVKLGMIYEGKRFNFYYRDGDFIHANLISLSRDRFEEIRARWGKPNLKVVQEPKDRDDP